MGRIGLRPRAQLDLGEIAAFTEEKWGAAQRRRYLALLADAMKTLAIDPTRGRLREEIGFDCRSLRTGRHVVFYRIVEGGIDVVRILHDAMDPALHVFLDES